MQSDVLCIYWNFVADIECSCERQVESGQYKKLLFIFSVGYSKTMVQNGLAVYQFSICVYDKN